MPAQQRQSTARAAAVSRDRDREAVDDDQTSSLSLSNDDSAIDGGDRDAADFAIFSLSTM
jgi:hypothetical protein